MNIHKNRFTQANHKHLLRSLKKFKKYRCSA